MALETVEKLSFFRQSVFWLRKTRTSESSHTETFSLLKYENRGTRPRLLSLNICLRIEAYGLMRLRSKRFWMRAAARLLFWRENRLYRQTEVPSEGMALLFHVKQRHGTNDEIVPRETSARNRKGLFHVKPFSGGLCSTWNNVHAGKLMFHMKHFPQKETCRQKFWDSAFVFF